MIEISTDIENTKKYYKEMGVCKKKVKGFTQSEFLKIVGMIENKREYATPELKQNWESYYAFLKILLKQKMIDQHEYVFLMRR